MKTPPAADSPAPPATWQAWAIGLVGSWLLRALALTLRVRVEDPHRLRERTGPDPFIFVFWHNRLLLIPFVWNRFFARGRPRGLGLTSTSRDGELIAQFLQRFGLDPVRGSATRRGAAALRELARRLARGHDVGITPDGSRGPLYAVKPGVVLLAQLTGRPVVPFSFEFSRAWRLKSWDRFFIPRPFSTVTFIIGPPRVIPRTDTPEAFEEERQRCEAAMLAVVRER